MRLPDPETPPPGYLRQRTRQGLLWVHADCAGTLARAGFGPESEGRLERSSHSGRVPLAELDEGGQRILVRRYVHGGLLRWLTGDRFLDAARPFAELCLSDNLRSRGIETPLVVAARARRAPWFGWRLDLATREVPASVDLGALLAALQRGELPGSRLRVILRELGRFLDRVHRTGLLHADLQPANILVSHGALSGAPPAFWVLDLDRSSLSEPLSREERGRNLGRLLRHVRRRIEERGSGVSRTDLARFLVGYESDRVSRKDLWTSIRAHASSGLWMHRAGWWLERAFGGKRLAPRAA